MVAPAPGRFSITNDSPITVLVEKQIAELGLADADRAFISYSHALDKPIAAALQSVVQKLGKPWYRRRALRVYRDDTSQSATPHLWGAVVQALDQSRFLILLASPEAAASPWGPYPVRTLVACISV
jgi:hypothetical protein